LNSSTAVRKGSSQSTLVRRIARWLDASPHPLLACEISSVRVAAARWSRSGAVLEDFAVEPLPPGAVVPSAVELNVANAGAVRAAVANVFSRLKAAAQEVALLVPDPVIRVFVQHFDEFPRSPSEAIPMLRWKLKKSVPFDADDTVVSYMRQPSGEAGVDIVTGLARQRIVREYEALVDAAEMLPGVVLSSSLAAVALLEDERPTLMARLSGTTLTTAIVREGILCGYRCTDLPSDIETLSPQMLLEEVYPVVAYYQDTWHEGIQVVRVAGLGQRLEQFVPTMQKELQCSVGSLLHAAETEGRLSPDARPLVDRGLDGLLGWMMNCGA
jgi:type IV pilus assembly protein PilM